MIEHKTKTKRGRPSAYRKEFAEQARLMCLLGAIDEDLAGLFSVTTTTIDNWKNGHPEFLGALKAGKREADEKVAESLFGRALGYSHPEEKIFCGKDGDITRAATTKHYPPDTTACIFWLKNRQRDLWRDQQDHNLQGDAMPGVIRMPEKCKSVEEWTKKAAKYKRTRGEKDD